ncbi:MAG: hypothetical protein IPH76_15815 [Xanthomonadales bacterium]|nr:hypothetical protein [Xanthomonadales bacterium]
MAPIEFPSVEVKDGRFELRFDAPLAKDREAWLEVAVRDAGSVAYASLPGRSKAISAPLIGACWSATGDAGSNPATHFLGTTDAQPLVLRTANVQSLRIEPSSTLFGGLPITANAIAGSRVNGVTAGVRGATISGGGVPSGDSDPDFSGESPNQIADHYGTIGGGYGNVAGMDEEIWICSRLRSWRRQGQSGNGKPEHDLGGADNIAAGENSFIGGGDSNSAPVVAGTVGGGGSNTAGGSASTVRAVERTWPVAALVRSAAVDSTPPAAATAPSQVEPTTVRAVFCLPRTEAAPRFAPAAAREAQDRVATA